MCCNTFNDYAFFHRFFTKKKQPKYNKIIMICKLKSYNKQKLITSNHKNANMRKIKREE